MEQKICRLCCYVGLIKAMWILIFSSTPSFPARALFKTILISNSGEQTTFFLGVCLEHLRRQSSQNND